jgi:FixJ family two-component response regulator
LAIMSAHPAAVLIVASQLPSGSYRALLDAIERPPPTIVLGALAGIEQTTAADDERVISVLAQPWRPRDLYDAIEAADRNSDTAATDADEKLRRASQAAEAQGSV